MKEGGSPGSPYTPLPLVAATASPWPTSDPTVGIFEEKDRGLLGTAMRPRYD
jgi:hypothetical protein